jgi:hypothetical protein
LNHRFWVDGRGWTPVRELSSGDPLATTFGLPISLAGWAREGGVSRVYNIEVEGAHTYFVSAAHVLVHNASTAGGGGPPNPYGMLGKPSTRALNASIASSLESDGFAITGGGGRLPEEYIPGPGGGRTGSTFVDITARDARGTLRVQTVDTLSNGFTPTPRELRNAGRILKANRGDPLVLVPKDD